MSGYTNYIGKFLSSSADYIRQLWATATNPLYGPNTPSMLMGSNEGNFIQGGTADDTIYAINTADRIAGGAGVDTAYATVDFVLPDDVENLTMDARWSPVSGIANDQDNIIKAVNAGVTVDSRGGDDIIFSAGGDTFIFGADSGRDTLVGFDAGTDLIRLAGYGFDDFGDVKAAMTQVGADTLLQLSADDLILFKDASVGSFNASNFQLSVNTAAMKLTFADEFNTLSLQRQGAAQGWATAYDWDSYSSRSAHTIGAESQIYVDPTFAGTSGSALGINPFAVADGVLTISADATSAAAKSALWNADYTSGLITTSGTFAQTYGYFEMRADLPSGSGAFPAFWLLPQDGSYDGEIDVMEMVNGGTQMWNHIHYRTNVGGTWTDTGFATNVPNLTEGFHTFGVLWTSETITWYVDGTAVNSVDTPAMMNKPMYMLANYAVGGTWAGSPDGSALSDMKIDYIRAYSLEGSPISAPAVAAPAATTHLSIAANSASVTEGSKGGTTYAVFTVTRSGDLSGPTTANWSVSGSGAAAADAADFTGGVLPTGQVFFGAGEASKTIWVPVLGDKTAELNESFKVTLAKPVGADIVTASAATMIVNDDKGVVATPPAAAPAPTPATLSISANEATASEGNGGTHYAVFTVTRTGDLSGPSTASWSVAGSGAAPANATDFGGSLPTGQVFFGGGESSKAIWVPISGDRTAEQAEGFTVTLSNPTGAALGAAQASATILNDDGTPPATTTTTTTPVVTAPAPAPVVSTPTAAASGASLSVTADHASHTEAWEGVSYATFTVSRTGDLSGPSTAAWAVQGVGSHAATAADFENGAFPGGTVFFGGGESQKTIWVPIVGGDAVETNETFSVNLSNPTGASIGVVGASMTLVDAMYGDVMFG